MVYEAPQRVFLVSGPLIRKGAGAGGVLKLVQCTVASFLCSSGRERYGDISFYFSFSFIVLREFYFSGKTPLFATFLLVKGVIMS